MSTATAYQHVFLDEEGVAQIAGANTKVIEIVLATRATGESPEVLSQGLPHLTPAQIHSALAYYWDHKDALDAEIQRWDEEVDAIRAELGQSPAGKRLAMAKRS